MPYGELIKGAFRVALHHRYLWFFGLFAGVPSFNCSAQFPTGSDDGSGSSGYDDGFPGLDAGLIVALALAAVVLIALFMALSAISQGALTDSVAATQRGERSGFRAAWRAGRSTFLSPLVDQFDTDLRGPGDREGVGRLTLSAVVERVAGSGLERHFPGSRAHSHTANEPEVPAPQAVQQHGTGASPCGNDGNGRAAGNSAHRGHSVIAPARASAEDHLPHGGQVAAPHDEPLTANDGLRGAATR